MRNWAREQRSQRGLSQAEVAATLGVSRQMVISIGSSRYLPSLPLPFRIAWFFDLPVDKMFEPGRSRHMMRFIRPRLRVPVAVAILGTAATAAVVVSQGWLTAIFVEIVWIVLAVGYYVWSGKDSDVGAVLGSRADERQATLEMKVTALQGKVMTAAAVVAFLIAVAIKATIWPFAMFVVLAGLSGFAGWSIYREHGGDQDDGVDTDHAQPPVPIKPGP